MNASPCKILFDARTASPSYPGVSRYIRSLLGAMTPLLETDERLHLIVGPDSDLPSDIAPHITRHTTQAPFGSFKSHLQAFRLANTVRPQLFHAPHILTPIRVPGKMILTVHDVIPLSHPQYSTLLTRLFWRLTGRRAIWHSRKIIGVSQDALKTCERYFGSHASRRSTVIYHGVEPAFRPPTPAALADVREAYGLPEKFLLYVGSDRPHKNLTTLLHALALMDPTATVPLALAGFDGPPSALYREAEQLGLGNRILWLNRVPEAHLPALYGAAHAFLFPSLAEGFGFPVIEAMACGAPVICSALNVLKEITGGAAKLVHPTDKQEWRRAIHAALVSLDWRDTYRDKGLARAARFSWEESARATLAVYRQLRGRTAAPRPLVCSTAPVQNR